MVDQVTGRSDSLPIVDTVGPRWGWLPEFLVPPVLISLLAMAGMQAGYLLFHVLAELTSILVGLMAMVVATTSRRFARNNFLSFVGVGLGWCALLDLFHTLVFSGMNLIPETVTNTPTQLWIAARGLQAFTLVVAPLFFTRHLRLRYAHLGFALVVAALVGAIATGHFPDCYIDGQGLTAFKIYAEYVIILALGVSVVLLWKHRTLLSQPLLVGLIAAVIVMMLSEFAFTRYVSVYGPANAIGHLLKIFAYWFVFVGLVQSSLRDPFNMLTRAASTFDAVPDPTIVVDHGGTVLQANRAAVDLAGTALMRVVGQSAHELFHDPDVKESECAICTRAAAGDQHFTVDIRRGSSSLECSVAPYSGEARRLARVEVYHDVTARNAAQASLQFYARRVEALLTLPTQAERLGEVEFMQYGMDTAEELTGSHIAFVHFVNEDQESIELIAWSRRTLDEYCHATYDKHYPISEAGIWAEAFRQRRAVVFNDYASAPNRRGLPTGHSELVRLISVPVLEGGKVRMMAGVGNKASHYTPLDVETLQLIAESVWRIVRQRRQQHQVEESEARYRNLFDNNHTVCLIVDPDTGSIVEANTEATRFYGWSREQMRGMRVSDINTLSEQEIAAKMQHARGQGGQHFEFRHRLADGSEREVEVFSGPISMGERRLLLSMVHDITERKRAAAELAAAQRQFAEVFEVAPIPMQLISMQSGEMLAVNRALREWLGYTLADLPNMNMWFDRVYDDPAVREQLREHWAQSVSRSAGDGSVQQSPELTLRASDGRHLIARGQVTTFGGQAVVAWTDLTDIRRSEAALQESELRFRNMIEQTVTGVYVRRDGRFEYVNDSFCDMIGYQREELLGRNVLDLTVQDPDNIAYIRSHWEKLHSGNPQEYIVPVRHKSGRVIQVRINAKQINWDDGLADIIMIEDITARIDAERKIAAYIKQIEGAMKGTLNVVSRMIDARDPYTAGHERRVGLIARAVAAEMGWATERCEALEMIGMVHDIGKISVPAEILVKPSRLNAVEMDLVRGHAEAGYEILKDVQFPTPVAEIIRQHHERMDGSGYPLGLKGEAIRPEARVLAVADVIESMSSHRPYRPALGVGAALAELEQGRGAIYDAEVVDAMLRLVRERGYELPE